MYVMRLPLLLATLSITLVHMPSTASPADDPKVVAVDYQTKINEATPAQRAELYKGLALAYYRDQNQEKAFQAYLQALDAVIPKESPAITDKERALYDEAMVIYLNPLGENPIEVSHQILKKYQPVMAIEANYFALGYIVAAAYANLEMFPEFFERFYISYCHLSQHYLAFKTRAVLHSKLFSRARTMEERELQRQGILDNLEQAIQYNPKDTSLYKMVLASARDEQKPQLLSTYLKKIIDENIITPRVDILFYVQQGVANNRSDLAQQFINKAREWYQYSRSVDAAQQYLNSIHSP